MASRAGEAAIGCVLEEEDGAALLCITECGVLAPYIFTPGRVGEELRLLVGAEGVCDSFVADVRGTKGHLELIGPALVLGEPRFEGGAHAIVRRAKGELEPPHFLLRGDWKPRLRRGEPKACVRVGDTVLAVRRSNTLVIHALDARVPEQASFPDGEVERRGSISRDVEIAVWMRAARPEELRILGPDADGERECVTAAKHRVMAGDAG